jgi:uncharacterized damage-inducible protein DinB
MSQELWKESLRRGLEGEDTYLAPAKLLAADPLHLADQLLPGLPYTARGCLYHTLVWSQVLAGLITGEPVPWPKDLETTWRVPDELQTPPGWGLMAASLQDCIRRATEQLEHVDLASQLTGWPRATMGWAYQVMIMHNSYHLGQLVALLRAAGGWPT